MAKITPAKLNYTSTPQRRVRKNTYLGQKDDQHASVIGTFKAAEATNVDFEINKNQGRVTLKKRKGYTALGSSAVGAAECLGLGDYHYYSSGTDTETLMAAYNSGSSSIVFAYSASGDWIEQTGASAMTADKHIQFQNANNSLYLYNGSDAVRKYNNTTWSGLSSGIPMSGAGNVGKYAVWHNNMNHVAGMTSAPSQVYISALADPEDFSGGYYTNINPEDGNVITGLAELGTFVVIFKNQGIYLLSGFAPDAVQFIQRSKDIGCLSHFSIAEGKDAQGTPVLYFFGNGSDGNGAVYMFDTTSVRKISDDISGTLEDLNCNALTQAAGVWDGNKYKLAVAYGTSTYNNYELVYYPDINQWTVNTNKRPGRYVTYEGSDDVPSLYFGDSNNSALVYQDNSGMVDHDQMIAFTWKGRAEADSEPFQDKKWKKLWLTTNTVGSANLSAFASVDEGAFQLLENVSLSGGIVWGDAGITWGDGTVWGSSSFSKHRLVLPIPRGKTVQLQYASEQSAGIEKIYEHELFYKPKKIK